MAIVARGLGQPEDGALVVGGLGTVEVDPNAMSATLTGTSTLTATLTAGDVEPPVEPPTGGGGNTSPGLSFKNPAQRRNISARLSATSSLTADLTYIVVINFDAELEELLLVGAL